MLEMGAVFTSVVHFPTKSSWLRNLISKILLTENEAKDKCRKILLQPYLVVKFGTMTYRSQNRGGKLNYGMYIYGILCSY